MPGCVLEFTIWCLSFGQFYYGWSEEKSINYLSEESCCTYPHTLFIKLYTFRFIIITTTLQAY